MLYQSTCVGFGYGLMRRGCFLEVPGRPPNPIRRDNFRPSSHSGRLGNINPIPIGYGFRPRLRGPANPARINLAQEPLDFRREGFSPSFIATHVSIRTSDTSSTTSRSHLHRPTERSATACADLRSVTPAASVRGLSPVTFSAQDSLSRPVSYYAFFKGWLLLSQPPGCLGLPTSFPT